jgi:hypothetical protein
MRAAVEDFIFSLNKEFEIGNASSIMPSRTSA